MKIAVMNRRVIVSASLTLVAVTFTSGCLSAAARFVKRQIVQREVSLKHFFRYSAKRCGEYSLSLPHPSQRPGISGNTGAIKVSWFDPIIKVLGIE